jgi:MerR family transcriptional regulator, light-induced transcriptional regulator
VSGIRTMSAAELLGVSPRALRDWERRFGYPKPRRTPAGHREYDLAELEPLRQALMEAHSVSSAIELARQRGTWPSSPARLLEAFGQFDEAGADRVMEESLTFRSVDRSVEEVLLPTLVLATDRVDWEAECQFAFHWATGWLFAARRAAVRSDGAQVMVLLDSSSTSLSVESLRVQALELGLRRAGIHTVLLGCNLPPRRVTGAISSVEPIALVLCGGEVRPGVVEQLVHAVRQADCGAPLFELGESLPESTAHAVRSLGPAAVEATRLLKGYAVKRMDLRPRTRSRLRGTASGPRSRQSLAIAV